MTMCDERERLIDYIYDESDPQERAAVQAHLAHCGVCRDEVGALRSVRHDLLAWSVPEQEPLWRPLPAPQPAVRWQISSAWGLAAAAAVLFLAGLSGAMTSRILLPAPTGQAAAAEEAPAATASLAAPAVTAADLQALEQRIRAELDADVSRVEMLLTQGQVQPATARVSVTSQRMLDDLQARLTRVERLQDSQLQLNVAFENRFNRPGAARAADGSNGSIVLTSFGQ
jgi:anti-sigma factor RsiW